MISAEQIEAVRGKVGKVDPVKTRNDFDIETYLNHYRIPFTVKETSVGTLHVLDTCLFDPSHGKGESAIGQNAEGKLFYQCFHNSCQGRTWHDAREVISGKDKLVGCFTERENGDVRDLSTLVDELNKDDANGLSNILEQIADLPTETEKEIFIRKLADRMGVSRRSIMCDIRALNGNGTTGESDDNILIAHPSYEVNHDYMALGFKENVLTGKQIEARNIRILATLGNLELSTSDILNVRERKLVFDQRERILLTLGDKWGKAEVQVFIANPQAPEELFNEIKGTLMQFIEFQNEALYGLVTAWIIGTYFHRCFNAYPFLFFYGKKQSGKSRILDLLERLAFNSIKVKGISVPSMTDSIDGVRATFLMDQAEMLSQRQNVELLGILADSYTPGGGKRRIVHITNKSRKTLEFETYSPKAFASIKEIDTDLKDRCVEIIMLRATKEYPYPEPYLPVWGTLRDKLYRLSLMKWRKVQEIYQTAGQGMTQRVRELWRPIDTVLTLEGVHGDERSAIRQAFLEAMLETQAGLTELEEKLIETINLLLGVNEEGSFTVANIIDKANIPESERFRRKEQERWAGKTLNKLYLFTQKEGREKNKHKYHFTREHLQNIFNRYQINGINGTMAEAPIINGLDDANKKRALAGNGTTLINPLTDAEPLPSDADRGKINGITRGLDNQQSCQTAIKAIEIMEQREIPDDDVFVSEDIPSIELSGVIVRSDLGRA